MRIGICISDWSNSNHLKLIYINQKFSLKKRVFQSKRLEVLDIRTLERKGSKFHKGIGNVFLATVLSDLILYVDKIYYI